MNRTSDPDRRATAGVVRAHIALGANLGDAAAALSAAFEALDRLPGTSLVARSSLYRTAPLGVSGEQPDYLNAVAIVETALSPHALLEALLAIEADRGRTRAYHNAPRTLDLDLLLYGDRLIHDPDLAVPHPRMHQRAFVLVPLAEIDPEARVPGQGTVADLLAGVRDQEIERLPG